MGSGSSGIIQPVTNKGFWVPNRIKNEIQNLELKKSASKLQRRKNQKVKPYDEKLSAATSDHLNTFDWCFGELDRLRAVSLLMMPENKPGAFLIRNSSSRQNDFCLSVLSHQLRVKHYLIQKTPQGYHVVGSQIGSDVTFSNLEELVKNYSKKANGLCINLIQPCCKPNTMKKFEATKSSGIELDRKSLKFLKKIDQGYYGEVYEGQLYGTIPVAIKKPKKGLIDRDDFRREAQLLEDLDHPNLIVLYGICMQEEPFYIVTEFMKHGSLLNFLKESGTNFNVKKLLGMAVQVAEGMVYLEKRNCMHRDLAARNVLVGGDSQVLIKIADFGMARWIKKKDNIAVIKNENLPVRWTAPEAILSGSFSMKSDVWSFGILLVEIFTHGERPYPNMSNKEVIAGISSGYRIPCPRNCPKDLYVLMQQCWFIEPNDRPTFKDILARLKSIRMSKFTRFIAS